MGALWGALAIGLGGDGGLGQREPYPVVLEGREGGGHRVGDRPALGHERRLLAVDERRLRAAALAHRDGAHAVLEHEPAVADVPRTDGTHAPHLARVRGRGVRGDGGVGAGRCVRGEWLAPRHGPPRAAS